MTKNPHFETASSWKAARAKLTFQPREPGYTAGLHVHSIRIHVRDHKLRELSINDRTLEAHYGGFVLSQARKGTDEARRLALDVRYGSAGQGGQIAGHAARIYKLGPEPAPDDIDGRTPGKGRREVNNEIDCVRADPTRPWPADPGRAVADRTLIPYATYPRLHSAADVERIAASSITVGTPRTKADCNRTS